MEVENKVINLSVSSRSFEVRSRPKWKCCTHRRKISSCYVRFLVISRNASKRNQISFDSHTQENTTNEIKNHVILQDFGICSTFGLGLIQTLVNLGAS